MNAAQLCSRDAVRQELHAAPYSWCISITSARQFIIALRNVLAGTVCRTVGDEVKVAQTVNQLENKSLRSARNFRQIIYYKRLPIGCSVPGAPLLSASVNPLGELALAAAVLPLAFWFRFKRISASFPSHRWPGHGTAHLGFPRSGALRNYRLSRSRSVQTQETPRAARFGRRLACVCSYKEAKRRLPRYSFATISCRCFIASINDRFYSDRTRCPKRGKRAGRSRPGRAPRLTAPQRRAAPATCRPKAERRLVRLGTERVGGDEWRRKPPVLLRGHFRVQCSAETVRMYWTDMNSGFRYVLRGPPRS